MATRTYMHQVGEASNAGQAFHQGPMLQRGIGIKEATTTGIELAVDVAASPTIFTYNVEMPAIAAVGTDAVQTGVGSDDAGPIATDTAVAAGTYATVSGFIKPTISGDVQLRIDTDAAFAATVKAGSFVEYRDLLAV